MKSLLLGCVAVAALFTHAEAAVTQDSTLPGGPYTSPFTTMTSGTVYFDLTTSVSGVYTSPFHDTSAAGSPFTAIEGDGSATFDMSGNQLSLIWGSPDSYNQISFYSGLNGGGTYLGTILGSAIHPTGGSDFSYVTINGLGNFESFVLTNNPNINAFEVSTFTVSSVPLPASLPMFGTALLGLGGLAYARRKARVAA